MKTINAKNVDAIQKKWLSVFFLTLGCTGGWFALPNIHCKISVLVLFIVLVSLSTIVKIGEIKGAKKQAKFKIAYRKFGYKYILTLSSLLFASFLILKELHEALISLCFLATAV